MFGILSLGGVATIVYVAPKYNFYMRFLTVFITVFELSIYLLTALKNPGIIIVNSIIKEEDLENRSKKYNITKLGFFISQ